MYPFDDETGIFQEKYVNLIAIDARAACVARVLAALVLQEKRPIPSEKIIIENQLIINQELQFCIHIVYYARCQAETWRLYLRVKTACMDGRLTFELHFASLLFA